MRRTEAVSVCVLALLALVPVGCRSGGVEVESPSQPMPVPMMGAKTGPDGAGSPYSEFASVRADVTSEKKDAETVVPAAHASATAQNEPLLPPPTPAPILPKDSPLAKEPPSPATRPGNSEPQPPANALRNTPGNAPGMALNRPPMPLPPAVAADPHKRIEPTTSGSILNLPPGKSPIEKALELAGRLDMVCADNVSIKERVRGLEESIQARDRLLNCATRDMQEATTQIARVRQDLATWAEELKQQQARLRQQDTEHQELLRTVIQMLEKELGPRPLPKPPTLP